MKKTFSILSMLLLVALVGCGGGDVTGPDGTTTDTVNLEPEETVSYACSNLISNGPANLDSVVSSYGLNAATESNVKARADRILFPFGEEGKDFSGRLKDVYYATNNIELVHAMMQNFTGTGSSGRTVGIKDIGDAKITIPKSLGGDVVVDPVVDGYDGFDEHITRSVATYTYKYDPRTFDQFVAHFLLRINANVESLRQQMHAQFKALSTQLDTKIGALQDDVNIIKGGIEALIVGRMTDVKNSFNSFCLNLDAAINVTEASNTIYDYLEKNGQFSQDLLDAIDRSKAIQTWAVNESKYTEWDYQDAECSGDTNMVHMYFQPQATGGFAFSYENPRKMFALGIGNLQFIAKMMLTKLRLNSMLYNGSALKTKNALIAQQYLDLLESSGIKQGVQDAKSYISNRTSYYISSLMGDFESIKGYPMTPTTTCTVNRGSTTLIDWTEWQYVKYGSLLPLLSSDGQYRTMNNPLLIKYFATLAALETKLKSYL